MNSYHELFILFFFFRNYFKVDTCSRLQITNHLSEIITFHLQEAVRKQNGLFATAAVIISEMFAPLVNQIARLVAKENEVGLGGEEMKPENSVSKKSIDKRRITTVKRLQKAEISSASSSSVQMNKHQVRRWQFGTCQVVW